MAYRRGHVKLNCICARPHPQNCPHMHTEFIYAPVLKAARWFMARPHFCGCLVLGGLEERVRGLEQSGWDQPVEPLFADLYTDRLRVSL